MYPGVEGGEKRHKNGEGEKKGPRFWAYDFLGAKDNSMQNFTTKSFLEINKR